MNGWVDRWMDGWVNGWVDRWVDGWVDRWVAGWMGGWMDGYETSGMGPGVMVLLTSALMTGHTLRLSLIRSPWETERIRVKASTYCTG